ncbi:hydroxyurea phosphotransferase [Rhizocola hellebori]|uniref:Hydroxyurea phosphotransferase n=1 Tax=Rhizocola hellebori TaxID=1392758 RepID=A0A8J3Q405_9ACTN|nr:aminoglycoside phosphotransferase family protein [Rhizocola hellebori]GIH03344.1 hydroxyurea phosphotransferase [Rhizocola hellebori]
MSIEVPPKLAGYHQKFYGEKGKEWIANLPDLAATYLDRWELSIDGALMHGVVGLVVPVRCADGTPAALKLQPLDPEHLGEGTALRTWAGQGTVLLLNEFEEAGSSILLLERLAGDRMLTAEPDIDRAVQIIAELLARLHTHTAPAEIRPLNYVVDRMLDYAPEAAAKLRPEEGELLRSWASQVGELAGQAGDRLLHWDLHYENVLAGQREPWLAIDPKPLAGDPGFDLMPALHNRWEEVLATGDVARAVLRRFDIMTEVLGLDRQRAVGYTIARVLQNSLWTVEDGDENLEQVQVAIAQALTGKG